MIVRSAKTRPVHKGSLPQQKFVAAENPMSDTFLDVSAILE
jgi:hypothetical protein